MKLVCSVCVIWIVVFFKLSAAWFGGDTCVPLPHCYPAVELILRKPFDPFTMKLFRLSYCGMTEKYPKVRCEEIIVPCETPDNQNGTCMAPENCQTLNFSEQVTRNRLREYQCDKSIGEDIQICCPNQKVELSDKSLFPEPELEQCGVQANDNRVVGGTVAEIDDFPWMALLMYRKGNKIEPACAGSLINNRYVVTAAHCADSRFLRTVGYSKLENVVLGEYDTRNETDCVEFQGAKQCAPPARIYKVSHYVTHPGWQQRGEDDIALVRLAERVHFNEYIRPICLPLAGIHLNKMEQFHVAGWGRTKTQRRSPVKMKAVIPIANRSDCLGLLNENQICAGEIDGKDTCVGDSGGPLMLEHKVKSHYLIFLVGIVSYGPRICGSSPAVYTYVPNYIEWIDKVLKQHTAVRDDKKL